VVFASVCSGDACAASGADTVIIVVIVVVLAVGITRGLVALARRRRPPAPDPEVGKANDLKDARSGSTRIETVRSSEVEAVGRLYRDQGWEVVQQSTAKSFGSKARVTITFRKPRGSER
jgi:hypothetical protein